MNKETKIDLGDGSRFKDVMSMTQNVFLPAALTIAVLAGLSFSLKAALPGLNAPVQLTGDYNLGDNGSKTILNPTSKT